MLISGKALPIFVQFQFNNFISYYLKAIPCTLVKFLLVYLKFMSKPKLQIVYEDFRSIILGISFIGGLLGAISSSISLINFRSALFITLFVIFIWFLLLILFKIRFIKWKCSNGQLITIKELNKKTILPILGALIILWAPIIFYYFSKPLSTALTKKIYKPVFDRADARFKILVLPFDKECSYQGMSPQDIGKVISKRLEELNHKDTLNLIARFYDDSINLVNFTIQKADSVMKYHHADQIIYGSYSSKQCEGGTSDKICFNYLTDTSKLKILAKPDKVDYNMIDMPSLEALRNGKGQEDIDYVIYTIAGVSSLEKTPRKALRLFRQITHFEIKYEIQNYLAFCYLGINDINNAEEAITKSLKISPSNTEGAKGIGFYFLTSENYYKAKEYYEKAIKIDSNDVAVLNNLSTAYTHLSDSAKRRFLLEKALKIDSNNVVTLINLGIKFLLEPIILTRTIVLYYVVLEMYILI